MRRSIIVAAGSLNSDRQIVLTRQRQPLSRCLPESTMARPRRCGFQLLMALEISFQRHNLGGGKSWRLDETLSRPVSESLRCFSLHSCLREIGNTRGRLSIERAVRLDSAASLARTVADPYCFEKARAHLNDVTRQHNCSIERWTIPELKSGNIRCTGISLRNVAVMRAIKIVEE